MNSKMKTARALAFALVMIAAPAAMAQTVAPNPAIKMTGSTGPFLKERAHIAIPAYEITFITQQQATAVASMEARTRLNTVLANVDQATMKKLTNEAYADLVEQLKAAGFGVLPSEQAVAMAAGVKPVVGNQESKEVGAGITIKKSLKKGYASFGADAAPMLEAFHNPTSPVGGPNMLAALGASGKIGKAAKAADATAIIPALTIDYIDMEASTGSDFLGRAKASANGELSFRLRATSGATLMSAGNAGPGYMQNLRVEKDAEFDAPFAAVDKGGADVRVGTMTATSDSNYQRVDRARGDAVYVDLPAWENLVRSAYKSYNAALVAALVKAKG